ncbi:MULTISPECIES: hypothetical protein, partial [Lactococcus]|uniref:hypothetical protein n=1 Tax=Lactococcus TaxID=1357 RepID=UPI00288CD1F1
KDLSFCHTKRRKKETIFFFRNRPSFSKTMYEQTKYERFFVRSSTKKNSLTVVATLFSLNALNSPISS